MFPGPYRLCNRAESRDQLKLMSRNCLALLSSSFLLIFNLVDALAGVALVAYGCYARNTVHSVPQPSGILSFVYGTALLLGTLLLLTSLLGITGGLWGLHIISSLCTNET